ncbi:MAG TPA: cbb3-type cytochrome c oxidase subunit I [Chthoniobacterales bacterium]|jgi:cytochrome c oxidase cbb3-type subunit 1
MSTLLAEPAESSVKLTSYPQPSAEDMRARAELDASAAGPVTLLFSAAIIWLLGWSVMHLLLIWKLLWPDLLSDYSFLTYGRLRPIATNMFVYGWASCAAMGVSLWLMVRLCRVKLHSPGSVVVGTLIWNAGLLAGIIAIHAGAGRSLEYLELPVWSQFTMFGGFAVIGIAVVGLFYNRLEGTNFITQAYIAAAFIWMAWTLLAGNIFATSSSVQGVIIAINNAWFINGVTHYWFTAIGLGTAFYLIPKVTGRPIHSYYLANLGFWSFAFLAGWGGLQRYNGGPIPAWLVTLNIVATALMIIPVATIAVNHHLTIGGAHQMMHYSPTLRFTVVGAMAFTVSSITAIILSLRTAAQQTGLTYVDVAQSHLVLYGFFTFIMFGAIYFIVPRLVGREWVSSTFIRLHFWGVAYGIGLTIVVLTIAGLFQGKDWANPIIDSTTVSLTTLPLIRGAVLGGIFLLLGHAVFALHFLLMVLRLGQISDEPTLMAPLQTTEAP